MKIDYPLPTQYEELVNLWQEAFGDTREFIGGFFRTAFSPARCRCVSIDGQVAAALYWMDLRLRQHRYAYIYAVAVAKASRGQGLCARLMADTREVLALRGYDGALLVPQDEGLRKMYGKMGYRDCTQVSEFPAVNSASPLPLERIDRDSYHRLRRELLPEGSTLEEPESIAFLQTHMEFWSGPGLLLAANITDGTLWSPEYLGDSAAAPDVLAALNCREGHFRTPGEGFPFAMFLPLAADAPWPKHLALCFD